MRGRINNIFLLAGIAILAMSSCAKSAEDSTPEQEQQGTILFSIEGVAQTKVDYNGIEADFEENDEIGLYAFYNNFYYYYLDYETFAESVIFANNGLTIDSSNNATYSPLKSWTFSTIYGTAPHTLDVVAYYPFLADYNTDFAYMIYDDTGAASLIFSYLDSDDKVNNVDFMIANERYDYSADKDNFRAAMLALEYIPLTFTRQMASMNFKVTKPEGDTSTIVVTGVEVIFDASTKMSQLISTTEPKAVWSNDQSDMGYSLSNSTTCEYTLAETEYDYTPEDDVTPAEVSDLLAEDNLLYFPPGTSIQKILFTIKVDGSETTYTWHAHVAEIVANTHYTLNLELDPDRAN